MSHIKNYRVPSYILLENIFQTPINSSKITYLFSWFAIDSRSLTMVFCGSAGWIVDVAETVDVVVFLLPNKLPNILPIFVLFRCSIHRPPRETISRRITRRFVVRREQDLDEYKNLMVFSERPCPARRRFCC